MADESPEQKSWFRRHPALTTIGGIFIFFLIVGLFNSGPSNNRYLPANISNSGNTAQETVAPSNYTQPTLTPAPTKYFKPTPTPTFYPRITPTPTPYYPTNTLSNDNYYTNSAGNEVHSPAYSDTVPAGASAKCRDGTYSFSQSRRGTCSHHGGVAEWL